MKQAKVYTFAVNIDPDGENVTEFCGVTDAHFLDLAKRAMESETTTEVVYKLLEEGRFEQLMLLALDGLKAIYKKISPVMMMGGRQVLGEDSPLSLVLKTMPKELVQEMLDDPDIPESIRDMLKGL